jgi:putative ABC transport system permease protein
MNLARRWRANAGWLALLALLCFAAATLVTAAPRLVNRYTDEGLREWISSLRYTARDVSYVAEPEDQPPVPVAAERIRAQLGNELPPALGDRVGESWYATEVAAGEASGPDLTRRGAEVGIGHFMLTLRVQSGAEDAARLVDGEWPRNPQGIVDRVEAVVSAEAARDLGLRVGSTVEIAGATAPVAVRIVGIFEPLDPAAPVWAEEPVVLDAQTPVGTDPPQPWHAVLLTDTDGVSYAAPRLGGQTMAWRFRLDESAITMADLPAVISAVVEAKHQDVVQASTVTSLDMSLADFATRASSARALLAIVQAGVTVALFGLVVLAGVVATGRRRNELALLRSRGASLPRLAGRLLAEAAPVVVLAVAGAYGLSLAVPGRPDDSGWLGVVFGIAAALTTPALAVAQHRRVSVAGSRGDLVRPRSSPRRVTAELTLIVVAVAGVLVLRRRGLAAGFGSAEPAGSEVDIYLALTPALVAAAAAVLALRLLPYPLRLLAAAAARVRGAAAFLGLARAGRAAPASAGPVAVLVIAVSVGTFCAAVPASLSAARDGVADIAVPGDALIVGTRFPATTTEQFAAAPGVTLVAPMAVARQVVLRGGQISRAQSGITVVVVDAPALDQVLRTTASSQMLPAALVNAEGDAGSAPALVSPDVAAALDGAEGGVPVQGLTVSFTVAAVAPVFPGLERGARFVVLPWSALPASLATRLEPTAFALAGPELDIAQLTRDGDTAQRAWVSAVQGKPYEGPLATPTTVLTHAQARADLERRGVDVVLDLAFGLGLGSGLLLALLAVGFAVAIGARARGEALSRLRTMGLARGQGRRLLAYEMLPLILAGALVGSVVGAALPLLLGPALGLATFSDGGEVAFVLDLRLPGLGFGLVVLAVVVAMVVEASMNRRARLGSVLRVGGES